MIRVLVANSKGGCGKTTIATELAAALALAGHDTALADADRQRSSLGWLERRPADTPHIAGLDWTKEIVRPGKRVDRLVIDAAAAPRTKRIAELVKLSDLIILPVLPSTFDEGATRRFLGRLERLQPVAKGRNLLAVVGNRIRAGTRATDRLETFFSGLGCPIVARLRDSQLYADAAVTGRSLFDLRGKRAVDLRIDWLPLLEFIAHAADE